MANSDWLVSRWMSKKVYTVVPSDRLVDAFEIMQERRIRHIPVVEKGKLVGIISDRDVRIYLPTRVHLEGASSAYSKTLMQTTIKSVLKSKPITVSSASTIREAAEIMCREKVGALPVVDDAKLVGIVSAEDVLWAFVDNIQNLRDAWEM